MRELNRRSLRQGLGVVVALALGLPQIHAADAADPEPLCRISPAVLEASGARIRHITVQNRNIFALNRPEEDHALFRLLNNLHIPTRQEVIRRQLLFTEGDPFTVRLLAESGRLLRATGYLYEADVSVHACDEENVDLLVKTRDVWTLKPGVYMARSGGKNRFGLDIEEENLLGSGGSLRYARRINEERRTKELGYRDANIGGRRIALAATVADNTDGHMVAVNLARPFYALDTRQAMGGQVLDERRRDTVYALGEQVGKFRHDIKYYDFYFGRSEGLTDGWASRWLVGAVYDQHRFASADDRLDAIPLPGDRRLIYPFVEYQLLEDRFLLAENVDQIRRVEDLQLGVEARFRVGMPSSLVGADRSGLVFSGQAQWGGGDPASVFWSFKSHASGRLERQQLRNAVLGGEARWYWRQSARHLVFASLRGDVGEALELDNPMEIGGADGLRGYPICYQRGESRAQLTVEHRYFTDYYLWQLFRVGGALFFDAGRVWGADPYGSRNLGLLRDVGFGLRLSSTRSSIGKMIHIDFAFPLDGDPSIDRFQFLVQGKRSF